MAWYKLRGKQTSHKTATFGEVSTFKLVVKTAIFGGKKLYISSFELCDDNWYYITKLLQLNEILNQDLTNIHLSLNI